MPAKSSILSFGNRVHARIVMNNESQGAQDEGTDGMEITDRRLTAESTTKQNERLFNIR